MSDDLVARVTESLCDARIVSPASEMVKGVLAAIEAAGFVIVRKTDSAGGASDE